ncbi:unnamed protein product [Caenorhabditis brenneri]
MEEEVPPPSSLSDGKQFRSVIYNAAASGNVRRIRVFTLNKKKDKVWIDNCLNTDDNNRFPLVIAARNGYTEVVDFLLELGADPSVCGVVEFDNDNIQGTPPLWAAAAAGHLSIVKLLVEKGKADVNQFTNTRSTPLRGACYDGHLDIVQYLIDNGADPRIPNRHGHSCLMIAAYRNKIEVVKLLLKAGIDPNDKTERGNTALHDAAESGNVEIIKILLESGGVVMKDKLGVDPLLGAALSGYKDVVNLLADQMPSAIHRRDALKLLGCTYLDKKMDAISAMQCWKEAMEVPLKTEELRLIREMETFATPKEVYEMHTEAQTMHHIEQMEGNIEAQRMQALIIRERILGGSHSDVHYYLRFRGAVYCDMGQMNRCYELWKHALQLQQDHFAPLYYGTITTLQSFQDTFAMSLNEFVNNHHANPDLRVKASWVKYIFNQVCVELERAFSWPPQRLLEDTECCGSERCQHSTIKSEYKKLVIVAVHLINILERLTLPSAQIPDSEEEKKPKADIARFVVVCRKLHIPILHHALEEKAVDQNGTEFELPKVAVLNQLLSYDLDVNEPDENGDTPLHFVLRATRFRRSLARSLLLCGAWIHARNNSGEVIFETMETLRKNNSEINFNQVHPERYMTLAGLCCNAMRVKYKDQFVGVEKDFPLELIRFYLAH